jgi:lipopolysaccharide transport system ATP-binding protein
MGHIAISCQELGKRYVLGQRESYRTLRDTISNVVRSPLRRLQTPAALAAGEANELWALDDVSFEVRHGDVVGIIGRNGSGKSTLLKILSRITSPTKGEVRINGRVGSLLEVGTGFHPELSGRENIYLNGAILGMRRAEIARKFDEIVAFSEVEKFIDTPVKRYSSGMYVRLAFAVAAHLEPEILLIDEVLAVGDAGFQKKCLGKMNDLSTQGRTVLFVSHNNSAVANLCNRGIVLDKGHVRADTGTRDALSLYMNELNKMVFVGEDKDSSPCIKKVELDEAALHHGNLKVEVHFSSPFALDPPLVGLVVYTMNGAPLFGSNTWQDPAYRPQPLANGVATLAVNDLPLHSGSYKLSVWLGEKNQNYAHVQDAVTFDYISPRMLPGGLSVDVIGHVDVAGRWALQQG